MLAPKCWTQVLRRWLNWLALGTIKIGRFRRYDPTTSFCFSHERAVRVVAVCGIRSTPLVLPLIYDILSTVNICPKVTWGCCLWKLIAINEFTWTRPNIFHASHPFAISRPVPFGYPALALLGSKETHPVIQSCTSSLAPGLQFTQTHSTSTPQCAKRKSVN